MKNGADGKRLVGFKRHLRAEVSDGEGVFLFSERGVTALRGARIESLATLLDGTRDVASLLRASPGGMDAEQVAALIARLVDAGLVSLRSSGQEMPDEQVAAYWETCGAEPGACGSWVRLLTLGDFAEGAATSRALRDAGLEVGEVAVPEPAGLAELSVVLCEDYLDPRLAEVDAAHRAAGLPWLLAKPVGAQVWIGPVFQPGVSGCWHCLATRLWDHRHAEACVQRSLGRSGPAQHPAAAVAPLTGVATQLVALEAAKWLAGYRHPGQQAVWTFDSLDLQGRFHELRVRPQCPECGDRSLVAEQAWRPVRLRPVKKVCRTAGGHRSRTPDQTLDRYRHLVSPVTGVIKEIKRDTSVPESFHSFRSGPNVGVRPGGVDALRRSLRDESGGKGATAVDAEAGALCEALERHSGRFHGDEERVRGSLRSLGGQAIHPNDCMLFDDRQYDTRADWNAVHAPAQYVCEPFDEDAVLDWTPVWSLTERRHRLLPTGMLYYGAPAEPGCESFRADSNGNAAGSCLEDAVLQGLLELVERDAVALWWYSRTTAPGIDLDAFGDPWIDEVRYGYTELGREVWVLDLTSDFGIPVMGAISRRAGSPREEIMLGFGAHLDPRMALRRGLAELNQLLPAVLHNGDGAGSGIDGIDDPDALRWWRHATVADEPYLVPDADHAPRGPMSFDYVPRQNLADDVESITAKLADRGLHTYVLDQTRPDIELPVVKVIVPGLRHFWARFGPGRLYDVPVELGRLSAPTPYERLNPVPVFL